MYRRMGRVAAAVVVAVSIALAPSLVACSDGEEDTVEAAEYEDCDTGDQAKKEDDCGYWQKGSEVRVGAQPDMTWFWVWYTWVIIGQNSYAPRGWVPPRGVTPPTRIVRVPKSKVCAMAAPVPPRPPAPAPKPPAPVPKVNNPAPKAPVNKAPVNQRPVAPITRPKGC